MVWYLSIGDQPKVHSAVSISNGPHQTDATAGQRTFEAAHIALFDSGAAGRSVEDVARLQLHIEAQKELLSACKHKHA
jgi:hypothetical protein